MAAPAVGLPGEIALADPLPVSTGRHPRHVDVHEQKLCREVVPQTGAVTLQDRSDRGPHLIDVLTRAGTQCLADRRLFSAVVSPKAPLQRDVRTHPRVHLNDSRTTGQDPDYGIEQLVRQRMTDRLLRNLNTRSHTVPQPLLLAPNTHCGQARSPSVFRILHFDMATAPPC